MTYWKTKKFGICQSWPRLKCPSPKPPFTNFSQTRYAWDIKCSSLHQFFLDKMWLWFIFNLCFHEVCTVTLCMCLVRTRKVFFFFFFPQLYPDHSPSPPPISPLIFKITDLLLVNFGNYTLKLRGEVDDTVKNYMQYKKSILFQ